MRCRACGMLPTAAPCECARVDVADLLARLEASEEMTSVLSERVVRLEPERERFHAAADKYVAGVY
jgi:hypothetical protein